MIFYISIYDDKEIDTESEDFKNKIADAVKKMILRDWEKITNVKKEEEMNNGKKAFRTIVEFNMNNYSSIY